ncbi:hypothetical protein SAMD00079811_17270 [Scytonema sp. HK-05]|nr:hypothetical protein SAMD00079811_17270 [Scytonema sp. HK-05]
MSIRVKDPLIEKIAYGSREAPNFWLYRIVKAFNEHLDLLIKKLLVVTHSFKLLV